MRILMFAAHSFKDTIHATPLAQTIGRSSRCVRNDDQRRCAACTSQKQEVYEIVLLISGTEQRSERRR